MDNLDGMFLRFIFLSLISGIVGGLIGSLICLLFGAGKGERRVR